MADVDADDMPDEGDESPADLERKQPSELEDASLYLQFKTWYLLDDGHSSEWRGVAKTEFDFVACDQWPETTAKTLNDEGRLPLTFNYVGPFVRAVAGLEIGTRHETVYLPRVIEEGDIIANETVSDTSKWMGDNCNAEDEQSEAFQDTLVCGMGWAESRMSYEEDDPDGKYMEEKLDVQEMRWDRSARKKNLTDARRVWRVRQMALDEARDMFPDAKDGDLNATWAIGFDVGATNPKSDEERRLKLENSHPQDASNMVHIVQVQWIERECYYRVAKSDGIEEMSEKDYGTYSKEAKEAGVKPTGVKQYRKVRKQAFVGSKILGKGPCPDPDRFTLQCITGMPHRNKGTWYGLVRIMRDPQINANKWLSQALHIMNATAKGGVIAEQGVFKNISEAQKSYSNPQAITVVTKDAITKGRIMAKPGAGLAAPYLQFAQLAVQAIPGVTGINLELMGMRDANQPGVLEAQRKQAGMTILATLFDSLRLYRKQNGSTRLYFIQNYLEDGKIIRVTGPGGAKAIRFLRDKHLGAYDVIVSEAPTTTNQKELTWNMLMQMSQVPQFATMLDNPEIAAEALNYCPLPSKIVQLLQKGVTTPKPEAEKQKAIMIEDALAKVRKTNADAGKSEAGADLIRAQVATKVPADGQLSEARAILALAQAGVQGQQQREQEGMNAFREAFHRQPTGMPPRMPMMPMEEAMAAGDINPSDMRQVPPLPTRAGRPDWASDPDIADLLEVSPDQQPPAI
jgi:hypothetical protein